MRIASLDKIPDTEVSHNALIKKRVLIGKDEIEKITYFSRAVFPPGEIASSHRHNDMTEVFYVLSGIGEILVDERRVALESGTCVTVEPNESHEIKNTGLEDLVLIYFGVRTT